MNTFRVHQDTNDDQLYGCDMRYYKFTRNTGLPRGTFPYRRRAPFRVHRAVFWIVITIGLAAALIP